MTFDDILAQVLDFLQRQGHVSYRALKLRTGERAACLRACHAVTETIYSGLDVEREICAVHTQRLGDTVLLWEMARHEAYRAMLGGGFGTDFQGVTLHRDNEPGYNQSGVYLIDDWR